MPAPAEAVKATLVVGQPNFTTGAPEGGARPGHPLTLTILNGPGGVAISPVTGNWLEKARNLSGPNAITPKWTGALKFTTNRNLAAWRDHGRLEDDALGRARG